MQHPVQETFQKEPWQHRLARMVRFSSRERGTIEGRLLKLGSRADDYFIGDDAEVEAALGTILEDQPGVCAIDVLRKALNSLRLDRPNLADAFEDQDLQKLLAAEFQSVDDLKDATKERLLALGLPRARVANLKP